MSDRFKVERCDAHEGWRIVDTATGAEVGRDGGEPEDQILPRDWSWVAPALNEVEAECALLRAENEALRATVASRGELIEGYEAERTKLLADLAAKDARIAEMEARQGAADRAIAECVRHHIEPREDEP